MRQVNKPAFATVVFGIALGFVLLLTSRGVFAAGLEADMVIYNGNILTVDSADPDSFTVAQAAAVYDGKFIAVGSNEEAQEYAGPSTQQIDLGGRTVIPGLVETHNHIYGYGSHFFPEGVPQVGRTDPEVLWTNKDEFLAQIRTYTLDKKPGEWIITSPRGGGGGLEVIMPLHRGEVTRFDLDEVAPNNPVYLHWNSSVEGLASTKALEPLLERYPDIPGIRRDEDGVPTGSLTGVANQTSKYEFWPPLPPERLGPYYKLEMEEMAAQGVTTISTRLHPSHLAGYSWLHARGELPTRLAYTSEAVSRINNVDAMFSRLVGIQGGSGQHMWGAGGDMLWLVGMAATFSIDSVPGVAGSCVSKPYPRESLDFPMWRFQIYGPYGLCRLADPDYKDADGLRAAAKYGFRSTAMHSGGDKGIDQYLDIIEELSKLYPDITERRWAIDHCRYLSEEHAVRSAKLGIMFSCGPKYVYAGRKGDIGAYSLIYGEEVAEDVVVPLRRLIDHGLRTTMQLDQHGFHPFLALEVAVNRKDVTGKVWGPQQRITRREALYMYTRWSSEYVLRENVLGSIEPRKYADFAVLSEDYLTVPEDDIAMIDPVLTVMNGEITYTQPEFATSQGLPQVGFRGNPTWWKRGTEEEARRALADM